MAQPVWKFLVNLGDASPVDCGGYFVYRDETGVYGFEAEKLEEPCEKCEECDEEPDVNYSNKLNELEAAKDDDLGSIDDDADDCEEQIVRVLAGQDWYDYAPETSPAALATAERAAKSIEKLNNANLVMLFAQAGQACALGRCQQRTHTPEDFGADLGMMLTGSGASWFDDHAHFPLKVPSVSFYIFGRSDLTAGEDQAATVDERFAREE